MPISPLRPVLQGLSKSQLRRTRSLLLSLSRNKHGATSTNNNSTRKLSTFSHKNSEQEPGVNNHNPWIEGRSQDCTSSGSVDKEQPVQPFGCLFRNEDKSSYNHGIMHRHRIFRKKSLHLPGCSFHTSAPCYTDAKTPPDQDPSLEWKRSGKEFNDGPDQWLPSKAMYTWDAEGAVRMSPFGPEEFRNLPAISVPTFFRTNVERKPDHLALSVKRDGSWQRWTYGEYYEDTRKAAKGFIALGLERLQGCCILGFNSPEWFMANLGAIMAGGIPSGIYTTNSPQSTAFVAQDSKANIFVVEDEQQLAKVLQHKNTLPDLRAIIQYKGRPTCESVLSWQQLMDLGAKQSDDELNKRLKQIAVNQCATLIYTSGTTGNPKGVMLSHDNLAWLGRVSSDFSRSVDMSEELVSYLPLSHVAAQMADIYIPISKLGSVYFADPNALRGTLVNTLREVQPTKFMAVPRVWEKMYEEMMKVGRTTTGVKLKLATWAKEQGRMHNEKRYINRESDSESLQFKLAKALVLNRVRQALGLGRSTLTVSAAAPISMDYLEYFMSLNIIITEAYGLSETSGPHCMGVECDGKVRFGSIGPAVEGTASKLDKPGADGQGELCLAGRHVFMGYLNREETTKGAIDKDGWFHTEDLARIDKDGFIFITGRLKELLITAGGENVAPVPIEDNVKHALPFLSNAFLLGDQLKFLAVLLTLKSEMNPETQEPMDKLQAATKEWVEKHGHCVVNTVSDVRDQIYVKKNKQLIAAIEAGISLANTRAPSRAQKVQKWYILPKDFSIPGGELGPTLKLKRKIVVDKYKDTIDEIYTDSFDPNSSGALG